MNLDDKMTLLVDNCQKLKELYKDLKLFNNEITPLRVKFKLSELSEKEAEDLDIREDSMKYLIVKINNLERNIMVLTELERMLTARKMAANNTV